MIFSYKCMSREILFMKLLLQKNTKIKLKRILDKNYGDLSKISQMVKEYFMYATKIRTEEKHSEERSRLV